MKKIKVEKDSEQRLDLYLSKRTGKTRSQIQKLVRSGLILINGLASKANYQLKRGDVISLEEKVQALIPKKINFVILYEDDHILIIDKPQGLTVHPNAHNSTDTLVNGLLYYSKKLAAMDSQRPGIVHRLDKETSGIMVIAKDDLSLKKLMTDFKERRVIRVYIGITEGNIQEAIVDQPIARDPYSRVKMVVDNKKGRPATTIVRPIEYIGHNALVEYQLITGRTHQIRVHSLYLNCPIVADKTYGRPNAYGEKRMMLHAYKLGFNHPISKNYMEINTAYPQRFEEYIKRIAR